ncbi:MAG: hypothetical protein JNM80_08010 [Phycisphaerae bacterium]|nr:hypothetical protein [Phycisphaerae bacterium]
MTATAITLRYARQHPDLPAIDSLAAVGVRLASVDDALVAWREGLEPIELTLGEIATPGEARAFSASAVNACGAAVMRALAARGLAGLHVGPDPAELDPRTGDDRRSSSSAPLTLLVSTTVVTKVRSSAVGSRFGEGETANRLEHAFVRSHSPLQAPDGERRVDVLRRDLLEDYIARLNRRQGRRVEAAISGTGNPGEAELDFQIIEVKPWLVYAQVSNTGTAQTSMWREKFGFIHNQLTNRDDVLSLVYATADFDAANAVAGSYERPIGSSDTLRGRVYGSWHEFTASEFGQDADFTGDGWSVGAEVVATAWQRREVFIDALGGVRFDRVHVNNQFALVEGNADFLMPYVGTRLERTARGMSTSLSATLEASLADATGVSQAEAERLGRTRPDEDWTVLRAEFTHSMFLEPLVLGAAWDDPKTPDARATMAHELAFSGKWQMAFGNRLIPQAQETAGGAMSVRGYPESVAAGDSVIFGSVEYRYHVPRGLGVEPDPSKTPLFGRPFRVRRETRQGQPDWDLVVRGFVDGARVVQSDRLSFERDETLLGAGVGVEVQLYRHLNARADWGVALHDTTAGSVSAGSSRFHLSFTVVY